MIKQDEEVMAALQREEERQRRTLVLIAAENYASRAVLQAQGSIFTNKYAEGYPGRRYYGGCSAVDAVERLAIQRAKQLFLAEHANVQPHSGTQANIATYFALLNYGDKVMGMNLAHGGHLTHGSPVNISGKFYKFLPYGVNRETETLDYEGIEQMALEQRPKLIVAGASAYSRIIDFQRFRHVADQAGAWLLVDMAHVAGLVAAGLHPSPVPHAQVVTSSTHKTLRGPRGGFILCQEKFSSRIDAAVFPGTQGGPLVHVIAAKAIAFAEAMQPEFVTYQREVLKNAGALSRALQELGLRIISGGTDNHLMLVDLRSIGVTGKEAEEALDSVGICINRNTIPFDSQPPQIASGIRLGTSAVTTRGFTVKEMKQIAHIIYQVLTRLKDESVRQKARREVAEIGESFPVPGVIE